MMTVQSIALVAAVVGGVTVLLVVLPFFVGPSGILESAAAMNDEKSLEDAQRAIIKRFLSERDATQRGVISKSAWAKRERFLRSRYIDLGKRLDHLRFLRAREGA